ncbi:hypothetical protein [Butyrivibrio sp. YAB3001]|uniref:hypothetical protein n=1 Tax=Butyrivibrio sp. YAB3001 TaxID=1520812 RepID=UPI0008F63BE9|nr:hypothetical protein [Butyrivibrio sp. YAB3001]SFC02914.1 hypothetical protein SAMN02910398_01366 [Butyrivibrio sp. YAB3001]
MDIQELKTTIDGFCRAMKLIEEKSNAETDLVEPARAEIAFFGMYIIFDEGSFDEEELSLVEEATGFKINRNHWNEIMELGRVDSEEKYLSQPPNTFILMVDVDNMLYEAGEELSAYNAANEVYKLVGDVLTNKKGFTDEKRQAKLDRFIKMIEDYRRENSKAPEIKNGNAEGKIVIPSKKGVQAPKKS